MSPQQGARRTLDQVNVFFASPRLASALTLASIAVGIFAFVIQNMLGWAGLLAMLATLVLLAAGSLVAQRQSIEWLGLLPLSLTAFVAWACISVFWSQYQWATLGALGYLAAFTALAIYVAIVRDTIQIVRAFGDVIRFTLALCLSLEVFSGLLIDMPISFLGVEGRLAEGGPISGIVGNRNELGLLAVIGAISFAIEWRTRSVALPVSTVSLLLAAVTLTFTVSPLAGLTALVAVAAMAVLYLIRRQAPERRTPWLFVSLAGAGIVAVTVWNLRGPIVQSLNATGELNYRLSLWQQMWGLVPLHPVEGWGWMGLWNAEVFPFSTFAPNAARESTSAVNAFLDVWFQLGIVGLVAFVGMLGLAFVRSWLLAARQRSVMYTWPAAVLAALVTASLAESNILIEFGWLTFVICCVKASQKLSWRSAFERPLVQEPL